MNKVWKDVEKRVATYLSDAFGFKFERITVSSPIPYDVVPAAGQGYGPMLGIECKSRKVIPKWLTDAIEQSQRHRLHVDTSQLTPIVVLATRRQKPGDYLVVLRLEDLCALIKSP